MPELRATGRTQHEIVEIPPDRLDCGHRPEPGQVRVGYWPNPATQQRQRAYWCPRCDVITWVAG